MSFRVQKTVFTNHLCIRIAEDREFALRHIFPDFARVGLVIHADSYDARLLCFEIRFSLRELAQLLHAEWSPVSTVEVQHYFMPALGRECEVSSVCVAQGEVRSKLLRRI